MHHHQGRFMREAELRRLGVGEVGENVAVHKTCVLAGLQNMRFGSNVRVDPFTLLSAADGWLATGDFVNLSACQLPVSAL